jgi:hypothetical protein
MENFNYTIGNRTRDPPVCSAVPQSTAPPCAPILWDAMNEILFTSVSSSWRRTCTVAVELYEVQKVSVGLRDVTE